MQQVKVSYPEIFINVVAETVVTQRSMSRISEESEMWDHFNVYLNKPAFPPRIMETGDVVFLPHGVIPDKVFPLCGSPMTSFTH